MKLLIFIFLISILVLIMRRTFYFVEKHDFKFLQALGAAAVAWVADVPEIIKGISNGIKYGIDFLKGKNIDKE